MSRSMQDHVLPSSRIENARGVAARVSTLVRDAARSRSLLPAGLVLLCGWAAILLRPAIPLDEIRYLEVAREMAAGSPWLPLLNGEPYSHKPPGLFWAALLLHRIGVPIDIAMRIWPALFSAATVLLVARIGNRQGIRNAGWIQAAFLLPMFGAQVLLFDTMLAFGIWLALDALEQRRDARAAIGMALALLAKGPVALLFLIPFGWAFAPAANRAGRRVLRFGALLVAALLPLLAWAIAAASIGGPEFARELFWKQSAGRVSESFAHAQPPTFYLPVLLLGLLPCTLVLFLRGGVSAASNRLPRILVAGGVALALFTLISGKQPHYLLPLAPAAALAVASKLEGRPRALGFARTSGAATLGVAAIATVVLGLLPMGALSYYGEYGRALLESPVWRGSLLGAAIAAGLCAVLVARARTPARFAAPFIAGMFAITAPAHFAIGRILVPRRILSALANEPGRPVAIYENRQAGMYNWELERTFLANPRDPRALDLWFAAHPDGWVIAEDDEPASIPFPLEPVVGDLVRGRPHSIYRLARPIHARTP